MESSAIIAIVISAAAFLTSIAGPCLTAFINCRHERKMYFNRFKTEHEHDVVEKYIKTVGRYVFSLDYKDLNNFGEASAEIFMYAPKELWSDIRQLNQDIAEISRLGYYEQQKAKQGQLQNSYLILCEKFSDLRRTLEDQKKRH